MNRRSGSFGILVLVVVLAIVLLLVARSWRSVAPQAMQVTGHAAGAPLEDHGQTDAADALRSGRLPDLGEMEQRTDEHARLLEQALDEIE